MVSIDLIASSFIGEPDIESQPGSVCGRRFLGGQRPSVAPHVAGTGPTDGVTAAGSG